MLRFILILSLYTFACSSVNATPDFLAPINEQKIQKLLNNWRASSGIPGATLSIYTPSQQKLFTFSSGTTQKYGGTSINKNTLFQAGSITKSFTSVIILKLESEGKLNINDPITRYLPQYPQWSNVTIRQLLNHTSGIANYTSTGQFNSIRKATPKATFTPAELVRMAGSRRLFPPGKGWKYSNTNYVLAGMIIEKVTGTPINQVMNNYIHNDRTVNLPNTFYFTEQYPSAYLARMAHGYNAENVDVTQHDMSWASTAGAIVTTSEDLLTWWYDLLQGKILSEIQLQKMLSLVCEGRTPDCRSGEPIRHIRSGEVGYGYGLGIIQVSSGSSSIGPVWWHNGTTAGYRAAVMWFPQSDVYLSLTINQGPGYLLKPTIPIIRNVMAVILNQNSSPFSQAVKTKVKKAKRTAHHIIQPTKKAKPKVNKGGRKTKHVVNHTKNTKAKKSRANAKKI